MKWKERVVETLEKDSKRVYVEEREGAILNRKEVGRLKLSLQTKR